MQITQKGGRKRTMTGPDSIEERRELRLGNRSGSLQTMDWEVAKIRIEPLGFVADLQRQMTLLGND